MDRDWARARSVEVRADSIKTGDGILRDSPTEVHEVTKVRHLGDRVRLTTRSTVTGHEQTTEHRGRDLIRKVIVAIGALAAAAGILFGGAAVGHGGDHQSPAPVSVAAQRVVPGTVLHARAPSTADGYAAMWRSLDPAEWGGADVSLSVDLPDGRRVWLYGDTLSGNNGFVHSTAIIQDGGALHVSAGGRQLLPNDDDHHIYWVESAHSLGGNQVAVDAAPMTIGSKSVWDFQRSRPEARRAVVAVDAAGDASFVRWDGWVPGHPPKSDLQVLGPNHYRYGELAHPSIKLAGGKVLYTASQNWDNDFAAHRNPDGSLRLSDWAPLFYAGDTP